MAQLLLLMESGITTIALPTIGSELGFSPGGLAWVVNAQTLAFGGLQLLGGRVADYVGPRRMFVAGFLLFALSSAAGAVASSPGLVIAARAGQGVGAAAVSPAALVLVLTTFPEGRERQRALGVYASMVGLGGALGFTLGGVLTDWLGWRSIFAVNVPLGVLAALLAPRLFREAATRKSGRHFDLTGTLSITGALGLIVWATTQAKEAGWTSPGTLGAYAGGVLLLLVFVRAERRSPDPLIPLRMFRNAPLRGANAVAVFLAMGQYPFYLFLTFYTQNSLGFAPWQAGIAQLPAAVTMTLCAGLPASWLIARWGARRVMVLGLLCAAAGWAWFAAMSATGSYAVDALGPSVLRGAGLGLAIVSVTTTATGAARAGETGLASGLINTTQQCGGAMGVAILVAVSTMGAAGAASPPVAALTDGYRTAALTGCGITLLGALLAVLLVPAGTGRLARGRQRRAVG
ncbi:MFS transporter [Streptomyces sp. NPDC054796]